MNALTEIAAPRRAEAIQVFDPIPALDSGKFEQMQRFANVLARSPMIPESFRGIVEGEGRNRTLVPFEPEQVFANCFLVVNQAVRWGMDPFAVISCCSIVRGRLMYEGKLVAAVIDAKLRIKLEYAFSGTGEEMKIRVSGPPLEAGGEPRAIEGTVRQWKTTGSNSPWQNPANYPRQLIYRGTREWTRIYEPAVLLGVYTPDELEALEDESRHSAPRLPTTQALEHQPTEQRPPRRKRSDPAAAIARREAEAQMVRDAQAAREKPDPIAERQREAEKPKAEELVEGVHYRMEQDAEGNPVRVAIPPADKKAAVVAAIAEAEAELARAELARLERLVADFLEAAPGAETIEELEAAGSDLEPMMADLPKKLAERAADAWEENRKRIAFAPRDEPEPEPDEPAVDTSSPDYQTGLSDARRGLKSCIRPAIKADEARLALWRAGWNAGQDDGST